MGCRVGTSPGVVLSGSVFLMPPGSASADARLWGYRRQI